MSERSSRFAIDLVIDCQADPSGVVDIGPALDRAFAKFSALSTSVAHMPQQTAVLKVPPGKYKLNSTPTFWIFTQSLNISKLIVEGAGDASVIVLGGGGAQVGWLIANTDFIEFRDLAFIGATVGVAGIDTSAGITINAFQETYFRNVRIVGVISNSYALKVTGGRRFIWDGGECSGCGCTLASSANLVSLAANTTITHFQCFDLPILDGFPFAQTQKTIVGNVWILVDLSSQVNTDQASVTLDDVLLDEGCFNTMVVKGSPTEPIHLVTMKDVFVNGPGNGVPATPFAIHVEHAHVLRADGIVSSLGAGAGPFPLFDLVGVSLATIRVPTVDPAATYNTIAADATTGSVIVSQSPGLALTVGTMLNRSTTATRLNTSGEVWASPTGSDATGNGSLEEPFATMAGVVAALPVVGGTLSVPTRVHASFPLQTDVTGTPIAVASFAMPNATFNGKLRVTGRMTNIGAGGGGAAVGDDVANEYNLVAKTIAGATTFQSSLDLYGTSTGNNAISKFISPSMVGTTFTMSNAVNAITETIDTTAMVAGAGAIVKWNVSIEGDLV